MWRDYSISYIKKNRASSISIIVAAFISALFLSFLCSLFYGFWVYEVEGIVLEEGDWQGRITGIMDADDLTMIQSFGNVKKAVVNKDLSNGQETVIDIYFEDARSIFQDMPLIADRLEVEEDALSYNLLLLSRYLIHDPKDESPPLLMTFYLVILLIVSFSLILIIRNSFAMSMNARIHQLGIFSSVGASPGQIRTCLIQEAVVLSLAPILFGSILGIALSFGVTQAIELIAADIPGRHEAGFRYHPMVFGVTILSSFLTVLCSAWLPAGKLSRMTPLEAIRNTGEWKLKKEKHSHILQFLFGIEGELAGNSIKARRKVMYTSTLSLTLSLLGFTLTLCFFTLSGISTGYTYFEKYQSVWDVMATVEDTDIEDFRMTQEWKELQGLDRVRNLAVYQRLEVAARIPETGQSRELAALGGIGMVAGPLAVKADDAWLVQAPVVVLDDDSFMEYCRRIGASPRLDGAIVLNRIWDSLNSNFRYPRYIPYVDERLGTVVLQEAGETGYGTGRTREGNGKNTTVEIPVIAYTQEVPVLREEYDGHAFVQFVPLSLWGEISGKIGEVRQDTSIRILAAKGASLADMDALEGDVLELLGNKYGIGIENRIQEKITNDYMIFGYQLILGGLCSILALIGIANVFSNTLGFLRQRRREFARYMSIGMTPSGIRRLFCIEALVIAGRPVLITLPIAVAVMGYMIKASYLDPMEFMAEAPIIPILVFCLSIFGFVALAYYLGGRKVLRCNLSDALRDDTLE
ncbi:ABC transporter permease [Enterocloster hominis (ex Hitch et al. 2024)]|uniref:ABC transporter permease n=1 Tax=Enterocloster hominis (ex Hitch et al. 2024) TaxID=1917870 RepID=A0ABV1DF55_9FIRM